MKEEKELFKITINVFVRTQEEVIGVISWYKYQLQSKNVIVRKYKQVTNRFLKVNKNLLREYEVLALIKKCPSTKSSLCSTLSQYGNIQIRRTINSLEAQGKINSHKRGKEKVYTPTNQQ